MKAEQLRDILNTYIERGHGDNSIVITLRQPSIGARAGCGIESVTAGFDWESGQIRLQPDKDLTTYEKSRDMPLDAVVRKYEETNRIIYKCPKCEEHLKLKQLYCGRCGQRVAVNKQRVSVKKAGDVNEKT